MARPPIPGKCKSRLAASIGGDAAAKLYRAFLQDTLHELGKLRAQNYLVFATQADDGVSVLESVVSDPWQVVGQAEGNLTVKLTAASRQLCKDGGAALIVGSDAPILETSPIAQLSEAMDELSVLLGPATDGGYYLIGFSRPHTGLFENIPWSTDAVAQCTRDRAQKLGLNLVELPESYDIDTQKDLERLVQALRTGHRGAIHTRAMLNSLNLL